MIFLSTEQSRYTESRLFEFNVKFLTVIFPLTYFNYASGKKETIHFLSFADNNIRPLYLPIAFISTSINSHITYTNNKLPYYTISYHITYTKQCIYTKYFLLSYPRTLSSLIFPSTWALWWTKYQCNTGVHPEVFTGGLTKMIPIIYV